jgi:excinuclease ABC subunit A
VIDRLVVNDDMKFRLSQSVQQSLRLGKDLMFVLVQDEERVTEARRFHHSKERWIRIV